MSKTEAVRGGTQGLRAKGLLIVAVPLLFEVAFALVVMTLDRSAVRDHAAEIRGREIEASCYRLLQLLVDAETGTRGFIISGREEFTEPFVRALIEVPKELRNFHALNRESLSQDAARIERLVPPLIEFQTNQRSLVSGGRRADAAAIATAGFGKRKMDAFRAELQRFIAKHRSMEEARSRASAGTRRALSNVIFAGLAVNIVVAVAMALYFMTSITARLGVVVDNTFRLERREELRKPLRGTDEIAHLDARFHEMASALEKSRTELESFSYSVSHDLRAPLRAINGYARMIEEDYGERFDGDGQRYLGTIRSEATRMGQLIDDLLAFSRLGRQPLQLTELDVAATAREALADVSGSEGTAVRFDHLPPAHADRAMLRQVFVNLLSNAIKFSARSPERRVEIGGVRAERENIYWVRDHGAGFDMRYADKLFGVFQRLHDAQEFDGTGVGLAIVHRVINRHGGRVWAESEVGRGACFFFSLPRPGEGESS